MPLKVTLTVSPETTLYELRKFMEIAQDRPGETTVGVEDDHGFYDLEIDYSTNQSKE